MSISKKSIAKEEIQKYIAELRSLLAGMILIIINIINFK